MELKTFIKKPVLSSVISILIVFLGLFGLISLPVEQYPDIAPPTVYVSTFYTGASAATIQKAVIVPLEEAINGVEDMMYITSKASNSGEVEIVIYFRQGTDPDMATVNVQNRVNQAEPQLPTEVKAYGIEVTKKQNSILQFIAISSPDDTYDEKFLNNYLAINLKPKVLRINGVGKMDMFGSNYSMRVWLHPAVMEAHHVTPTDVLNALSEQNLESATGTIGDNSGEQTQFTMVYSGRLKTIEEFQNIIVKTNENGETLYLRDIADIELGSEFYSFISEINEHPGAICAIYQTAGSNASVVNNQITALIEEETKILPPGMKFDVLMNTNDFLNASMHEVVKTLIEAIILVVLIVLLFLHDWQSTIIPFVGIMVSLIGTFAFMQVVGFSINLISLFALVLVIGTVVDDSIVVVEAVHAKLDQGYKSSAKASIDAMSEITMAVITSSLVFMAVFIPVSMMSGTSGTFFRQFGLTMAVAVGISALNALTLSPALCAIMIKPHADATGKKPNIYKRFCDSFDAAFHKMSDKYKNGLKPMIHHPWIAFIVVIASFVVMGWMMIITPSGFVPQEDKGMFICEVMMPAGTSLQATSKVMQKMEADIMKMPNVQTVSKTAGYGFMSGRCTSAGFFIVAMKPWEERPFYSIAPVMKQVFALNNKYRDAMIIPFQMPMIPGYGNSADAEIYLQDKVGGDVNDMMQQCEEFIAALNQHPDIQAAYTSFNTDNPQYLVEVDVARCHQAGLKSSDVLKSLSIFMGGSYNGDINLYGKVYKVMVQGTPDSHNKLVDLTTNYIRTSNGEMAPLSNFLRLRPVKGSATLSRFNLLNSIQVNASPAKGKSTGELINAVKEVSQKVLSRDYTYEYGGMTREQDSNGSIGVMFVISALLIFLVLSCLYESYIVPFSIMLAVPLGLMGAFLFTKLFGLDNNIYLQTGVVMMIGLLSKTGILIVEFALHKRKVEGLSIVDSALEAAKARLRPIMMTAGTMVIGLLPLLTSRGVGAMGNISLGVGTVFGMLIGCVGLLFLIPALYVVFETIQEKVKPLEKEKEIESY